MKNKPKDSLDEILDMGKENNLPAIDEKRWIANTGFSKANNMLVAERIIDDVEQGTLNPLDAYVLTKSMESTIKMIVEGIKDKVLPEAEKHGKSFKYHGCDIQVKEAGVKYDFAGTGDTVWIRLTAEIDALTEKRKERENFLKTIRGSMDMASEDTDGETISIKQAVKTSTTSISVTIK